MPRVPRCFVVLICVDLIVTFGLLQESDLRHECSSCAECLGYDRVILPLETTSVDPYAFSGCTTLVSIQIPDSVTIISEHAFSHCTSLEEVIFGTSLTEIDDYAFYYCLELKNLQNMIGTRLNRFGFAAFAYDISISQFTMSNDLIEIDDYAFFSCETFSGGVTAYIYIPEGVVYVGVAAFAQCSKITKVLLPYSLVTLGDYAFYYCWSLKRLDVGTIYVDQKISESTQNELEYIGDFSFAFCEQLRTIAIPLTVTYIGDYTFQENVFLSSITMGQELLTLGDYSFSGCIRLKHITLPKNLNRVGKMAFERCDKLTLNCADKEFAAVIGEDAFADIKGHTCCKANYYLAIPSDSCEKCNDEDGITRVCAVGAMSPGECKNPISSFVVGIYCIVVAIVVSFIYLVYNRYALVALRRRDNLIKPLAKICRRRAKFLFPMVISRIPSVVVPSGVKVFIYIYIGTASVVLITGLLMVRFLYGVMFNSIIIYRGFNFSEDYRAQLQRFILGFILLSPLQVLFVPILQFGHVLADYTINFDSLQIACVGSQAPAELLINIGILGIVCLFVESQYQIFWTLTVQTLNASMVKKLMRTMRQSKGLEIPKRAAFVTIVMMVQAVADPFQMVLRYCMAFVQIRPFARDVIHEVTESCDHVPGFAGVDSALGISSSVLFWILVLPCLYAIAHILIPRCHGCVNAKPLPDYQEAHKSSSKVVHIPVQQLCVSLLARKFITKACTAISPDIYILRIIYWWVYWTLEFCTIRETESGDLEHHYSLEGKHRRKLSLMHYGGAVFDGEDALANTASVSTEQEEEEEENNWQQPAFIASPRLMYRMTQQEGQEEEEDQQRQQQEKKSNENDAASWTIEDALSKEEEEDQQRQQQEKKSNDNDASSWTIEDALSNELAPSCTNDSSSSGRVPPVVPAIHDDDDSFLPIATHVLAVESDEIAVQSNVNRTKQITVAGKQEERKTELNYQEVDKGGDSNKKQPQQDEKDLSANIDSKPVSKKPAGTGTIDDCSKKTTTALSQDELYEGSFPSYFALCVLQHEELCRKFETFIGYTGNLGSSSETPTPPPKLFLCLLLQCIAAFLYRILMIVVVLLNFGHIITRTGREHWKVVLWKYWMFVRLCVGYWDEDNVALRIFKVFHEFDLYCPQGGFSLEEYYSGERDHSNWSRALGAITGTRAIIIMVLTNGSLVSIFILLVCPYPIFVYSKELLAKLPPAVMTDIWQKSIDKEKEVFATVRNCTPTIEISGGYRIFRVYVRYFAIAVTQGRRVCFAWGCLSFITAVVIIAAPDSILMALCLMIKLVHILAQAAFAFLHFGTIIQIDNSDFENVFRSFKKLFSFGSSTLCSKHVPKKLEGY